MLLEQKLTTHLLESLQQGEVVKITKKTKNRIVELRREVGNNSFFADILISLLPKDGSEDFFDNKKTEFIAIEVKISNWKQGLYQAWRYASFAEQSYLALYKDYEKNVDLAMFKQYNVGLIIFDENCLKILHKPTRSRAVCTGYRKELRETIWRNSLTVQSVQPAF